MSHSCSLVFQNSGGIIPPDSGVSSPNPFAQSIPIILGFDNNNGTIDSTGSIGLHIRAIIKRNAETIETTPSESNTGTNQIPYTSTLENGDELCVQTSNNQFETFKDDCLIIPTPAFTFMDACPIILIDEILISGNNIINVDGATTTLTTNISPSDAAIQTLIWTSSDPSLATVNQLGVVTPRGNGTVTIHATANDGGDVVGDHIITISNQTGNTLLISDTAPDGGVIIQYNDLIGLDDNQIELYRDGMIQQANTYNLIPTTGVIELLSQGDIFEEEDIEIRLT